MYAGVYWAIIDTGISLDISVASQARFSMASSACPGNTRMRTISGGAFSPLADTCTVGAEERVKAQRMAARAADT